MTREDCEKRLNLMISGEDTIDLEVVRECAATLGALSSHPRSRELSGELVKAIEALEMRLIHEMPLSMVTKLRVEADAALTLMLTICQLEPQQLIPLVHAEEDASVA